MVKFNVTNVTNVTYAMRWFNPSKQQEAIKYVRSLNQAELIQFVLDFQHECSMQNEDRILKIYLIFFFYKLFI